MIKQLLGRSNHEERYTLITGEIMTVLYDAREDSPTYGVPQNVYLSGKGTSQLVIPRLVWHMNVCLGTDEAVLINCPTEPYCHENPDRLLLPWDTEAISVDVKEYFPRQWGRRQIVGITESRR
jgi:dTDP-4-dehydrorhamnose 3,5-epimerase